MSDDGAGPRVAERLSSDGVAVRIGDQLVPELADDLKGCAVVVFVDRRRRLNRGPSPFAGFTRSSRTRRRGSRTMSARKRCCASPRGSTARSPSPSWSRWGPPRWPLARTCRPRCRRPSGSGSARPPPDRLGGMNTRLRGLAASPWRGWRLALDSPSKGRRLVDARWGSETATLIDLLAQLRTVSSTLPSVPTRRISSGKSPSAWVEQLRHGS